MRAREFRHKVSFVAFRDKGTGQHNSKREFSDPVECYVKITPTSPKRLIDDVNSFGKERAVTHLITMRPRDDLDVFTYMIWNGEYYRIYQTQISEDRRSMSIGVIYERKAEAKALTRAVFDA